MYLKSCIVLYLLILYIYLFNYIYLQAKWKNLMIVDKAVAPYYLTPEKHAEHFTKRKAGLPAYDI
jgi:hypothetical protein